VAMQFRIPRPPPSPCATITAWTSPQGPAGVPASWAALLIHRNQIVPGHRLIGTGSGRTAASGGCRPDAAEHTSLTFAPSGLGAHLRPARKQPAEGSPRGSGLRAAGGPRRGLDAGPALRRRSRPARTLLVRGPHPSGSPSCSPRGVWHSGTGRAPRGLLPTGVRQSAESLRLEELRLGRPSKS